MNSPLPSWKRQVAWPKNGMTLKWQPKKTPAILLAFFKFVQLGWKTLPWRFGFFLAVTEP